MNRGRKDRGLFLPMALLISLTTLFPIGWALIISFYRYSVYDLSPAFVGFENFSRVFKDRGLILSLNLTVLWSALKTLFEIGISFLVAIRLRHASKATRLSMVILGIGWFFPSFITVSAWRGLVQGSAGRSFVSSIVGMPVDITTQPVAAFVSTLFVAVWLSIPLSTIIITGMLQSVSSDIEDNMKLDGINELNAAAIFFSQIRTVLIPFAFFQFARSLKEFSVAFLMSGNGPLVPGGFTPGTIVGSTTFMGVLLFRKFAIADNYGLLAAYSAIVGVLVFGWLLAAMFSRLEPPKRHTRLLMLSSLVHLALSLFSGRVFGAFLFFCLYLLPLAFLGRRLHFRYFVGLVLIADSIHVVLMVITGGLASLPAGSFLAIPAMLLSMRYRISIPNLSVKPILKRALMVLVLTPTVVLMIYIALLAVSPINDVIPRLQGLRLESFRTVLFKDSLLLNLLNSLRIALLAIIIVAVCVFPFAYSHAFKQRKITSIVLSIALFGTSFAGMHTLLPVHMVFGRIGLLNSFLGVALLVATQCIPLSVISLIAFFKSIPREFRELFLLEGSNEINYFLRVALPLSLPMIGGIATYVFVSAWGTFTTPLLFIDRIDMMPFSLKIYSYVGEIGSYYSRWNLFAAASLLGIVPLLLFYRRSLKFTYSGALKERGVVYE